MILKLEFFSNADRGLRPYKILKLDILAESDFNSPRLGLLKIPVVFQLILVFDFTDNFSSASHLSSVGCWKMKY